MNKAYPYILTWKGVQGRLCEKKKTIHSMLNMSSFGFKTVSITNHVNVYRENEDYAPYYTVFQGAAGNVHFLHYFWCVNFSNKWTLPL